jgi:protein ImuA
MLFSTPSPPDTVRPSLGTRTRPAPTSAEDPAILSGLPKHLEGTLWRGDQIGHSPAPTCPTGFATLDAELPGGGWPTAALTELLLASPGQGELRLLGCACATFAGRPVLWVAPPLRPYLPALGGLGWPTEQLIWIDPAAGARHATDAAWATEQAVKSHSCAAVLWWAPQVRPEQLRRLHLAAQGSDCLLFVLRPPSAAAQSSPAPLRLSLQADVHRPGGLTVQILKRRGPALGSPLHLDTRALFAPALARRLHRPLPRWPVAASASKGSVPSSPSISARPPKALA